MASKIATKQEILQVRTALCIAFPKTFAAKGGVKKPLKIGIRQDLMSVAREQFPGLSRRLIDACIRDYCGGHNYLKALRKGASRIDLNGAFSGFVTADEQNHADQALRTLKALKKKGQAKKEARRKAKEAERMSRPEKLRKLKEDLSYALHHQQEAEIRYDDYYTSGRKAKADAEILALRQQIAELERMAA